MNRLQDTNSYHHGDLRQALLRAARDLIKRKGLEGLSIRQVAREAGVSPGAPYHHFKEKNDLLAALAQQSLKELERASLNAIEPLNDPQERLEALGSTYITFALDNPNEFKLMFSTNPDVLFAQPEPSQAPVFRVLLGVVAEFDLDPNDHLEASISAWSLVHGLASLLDGPLKPLGTQEAKQLVKGVLSRLRLS